MSTPPTQIDTERLTLRRDSPADAVEYYELGIRNREHLAGYETDNPIRHLASKADALTLPAAFAESWDAGESYFLRENKRRPDGTTTGTLVFGLLRGD